MKYENKSITLCTSDAYLLTDSELTRVKFVENKYLFETNDVITTYILPDGEKVYVKNYKNVFRNEEEYKKGIIISDNDSYRFLLKNIFSCTFEKFATFDNGQVEPYYLDFKEGEVVEVKPEFSFFTQKSERLFEIKYDIEIPNKYNQYSNKEEVFNWNQYVVVDENGNKEAKGGIFSKLVLKENQNELLDRLDSILKECENSGINFQFNTEDGYLFAFNGENATSTMYDGTYLTDGFTAYELDSLFYSKATRTLKANVDGDYCDNSVIGIKN